MDPSFAIAQALRESHCDRKGEEHSCVGTVTIKRGEMCLNCPLCGSDEGPPLGWSSATAAALRCIFSTAGINWDSLDIQAQASAVREAVKIFGSTTSTRTY